MTESHSIKSKAKSKPKSTFPLFCHKGSGQWAKKCGGKLFYFGTDKTKALEQWVEYKDQIILTGRKPTARAGDRLTVKRLCDLFLENRERRVATGELAKRTFDDYQIIAKRFADHFGRHTVVEFLTPADFAKYRDELGKRANLKTLETLIAKTRAILNYADKRALLEVPLSRIWGQEFAKPSKSKLAALRNETVRLFEPEEIRNLIESANPQLRAMIYLGINAAFGNNDCAKLKFDHVDLKKDWVSFPRPKTGIARRCPLWKETIDAIQKYIVVRKPPANENDSDILFTTSHGGRWEPSIDNKPLTKEFTKLRKSIKITARGKTFYTLRHCFQTVGDETRDFIAVSSIMGHSMNTTSDGYREKIGDDRLKAVTDHVRSWLNSAKPKPAKRKPSIREAGGHND